MKPVINIYIDQLAMLALLSASIHWLVARSAITKPLWSRARGWLAELLKCAGCSGFWIGLGLGALGIRPVQPPSVLPAIFLSGLLAVFLTPIFEGMLLWGLRESAIDSDDPPAP